VEKRGCFVHKATEKREISSNVIQEYRGMARLLIQIIVTFYGQKLIKNAKMFFIGI
jgi:hypothetical protein